jgi:hypothetical protein
MDTTKTQNGDALWLPIGIALGAVFGSYLNDTSTGMSLGLMVGATISMLLDYRSGKRSIVWAIVGAFAVVWTLGLVLIERA